MRNIKLRAWDKYDCKMIVDEQNFIPLLVTNKGVLRLSHAHKEDLWQMMPLERFEFMEFTGVEDVNGNEIYEGDIVEYYKEELSIITFEYGSFCLKCVDSMFHRPLYDLNGKVKIVGNIYENSELIDH